MSDCEVVCVGSNLLGSANFIQLLPIYLTANLFVMVQKSLTIDINKIIICYLSPKYIIRESSTI